MLFYDFLKEGFDFYFQEFKKKNINNYDKKYHTNYISIKEFEKDIKVNSENIFNSIKNNNYKFQSLYPIVIENKKELNKK
ncbi:reverse transcriptase, partial [Acinetobacter baumannii]|nr:reverse transcriptase [Acinetobacter baumannii]MBU0356697.1 reverse transcriptase [Acinetobacter baumannii]